MRRYEVEVTEYGKTKEKKLFNNQVDAFRYANSIEQRTGVKIAEVDGESYLLIANREEERHVDHLIRHKWPEEKPEEEKSYLTRVEMKGFVSFQEMYWSEQYDWHTQWGKYITHWWELPEVRD